MNTFISVVGALVFFVVVFGPVFSAIFRDPLYGSASGPASAWYTALKERARALALPAIVGF